MRDYFRFARSHRRFLAFGFALLFFSSFGQTFYLSLFSADIRDEFELSHGGFGSLYSLATLASGLTILFVGRLIDRVDLRRFTVLVCAGLVASAFFLAVVPGTALLVVALFAIRLTGQGLLSHTAATSMSRYFERGRGKALSIATLGLPAGEATLPPLAVALTAALGWRGAWVAVGITLALVTIPLVLWLLRGHDIRHRAFVRGEAVDRSADDHGPHGSAIVDRGRSRDWTQRQVARDARFWGVVPAIVAPAFLMTGFFFHQVHVVESKGWSLAWYSACFWTFASTHVVSSLLAGPLVDRHGAVRALPYFNAPLAASFLVLSGTDHAAWAPVYLALAGLSAGSAGTIAGALWAEAYGPTHLGAVRSMVSALFVLSTAASPVLMGQLIDHGWSVEALALWGTGYTVAAGAAGAVAFRGGAKRH